jgi:hypothetical protein
MWSKVAGVGDGDKEELDAELRKNELEGVRREVVIKNNHILGLMSGSKGEAGRSGSVRM